MKILVVSLAGIGDTLFTTPLIHELRLNFPAAQIDAFVLYKGSCDLFNGNPHLNNVFQKNLIKASSLEGFKYMLGLRKENYDVSLNTHPQSRIHYRLVARLIGARMRVSHSYECFSALDHLLVNRVLPQDYSVHAVENNLRLLQFLDAKRRLQQHRYELYLTDHERSWARDYLAANQLAGRPLLGVHVGSGGTKNLALRRWPLSHYAALFEKLKASHRDLAILLFGGPEEAAAHHQLCATCDPAQVFTPQTSDLRQAAALLTHCKSFLSVDTALMHLAAAMQVPGQVVIETPTWNKPIEPFGNKFTLVSNPKMESRHLEYYRYDGKGIQGSAQEITSLMASITPEMVHCRLAVTL